MLSVRTYLCVDVKTPGIGAAKNLVTTSHNVGHTHKRRKRITEFYQSNFAVNHVQFWDGEQVANQTGINTT